MEMALYKKIIDEAKDFGVCQIRLFLAGEPFLHKGIAEMISYAGGRDLETLIHTNATLLDETLSRRILEAGLDLISFSFDGETKEEYESIRHKYL